MNELKIDEMNFCIKCRRAETMKTQIIKLAAHMLGIASDTYSNHGCNDLDADVTELMSCWTDEQRAKFIADANEWNGENMEIIKPEMMPDWMVMEVLRFQLQKYF